MFRRWVSGAAMATVGLLAICSGAAAGGWATVGLSSLPTGIAAGEPWDVRLTILQHARTPLSGVEPRIRVVSMDGRTARSFAAQPTGRPGVYRARVVFPTAGTWRYVVDDGFTQKHAYPPVQIGAASAEPGAASGQRPAAPARDRGPDLTAALVAALAAGLLAAGLGAMLLRRRRPAGAATPAPR